MTAITSGATRHARPIEHIGIVAHSAEGAALCYRTVCQAGAQELGTHEHPDVTLTSIGMGRTMPWWDAMDLEPIFMQLREGVARAAKAGATFFICPDNTAHIALDRRFAPLPLPGIHIADAVCDEAESRGYGRIGVLGTRYTMDGPVYRDAFAARGIEYVVPEPVDRARINDIIFDELCPGLILDQSQRFFTRCIEQLAAGGCDAVVLGCTEIPLIVTEEVSPLPLLDSTRLLARAAVAYAVGKTELSSLRLH